LRLLITEEQEPWAPALDGELRVSSLQTGVYAGPVGSREGQVPFDPNAVVTEEQENVRLYTPQYGRLEVRLRALDDPRSMVALWCPGYEGGERSGEVLVCEIFGRDVHADHALVGVGVRPFDDPALEDHFEAVRVPIDAREFHVYRADWMPDRAEFFVDGELVKTVPQSPAYPIQLMLGIYEFPPDDGAAPEPETYPKAFVVDYVRGYRLAA